MFFQSRKLSFYASVEIKTLKLPQILILSAQNLIIYYVCILDKKIDVKKLQYGSKIDAESKGREEYFTVKEIISPELIKLNNDVIIRLIGIKQNPKINGAATDFLRSKLKGKRVFLKHDSQKFDADNHLMAYLYLENKTFVNAHLLKAGMVDVDNSFDFKYRNKFSDL